MWILNPRIQDIGSLIQDSESSIQDPGSQIMKLQSRIMHPGCRIPDLRPLESIKLGGVFEARITQLAALKL
jgi:hypothetical protein